ncbi:MAG: hypothetical protein IAI50_13415, partial [Candidatus Eremiobacteraeota bacterium]|nr:hypothetical protein [Candidatus Eremiobacteraeota bacterium]
MTTSRSPYRLLPFLVFTAVGLLFFTSYYLDDLARMRDGTALARFIEEMTGAYSAFVLLPIITVVARRFPMSRTTWKSGLLAAMVAALGYTIVKTTLMSLSRAVIFPLAGLGHYDYGVMLYRYPMEAAKDV